VQGSKYLSPYGPSIIGIMRIPSPELRSAARRFCFVLAIFLLSAFQSLAHGAERRTCAELARELSELPEASQFEGVNFTEDRKSVEVVGDIAGDHGGKKILLKRTRGSWFSWVPTAVNAPQGDPRWAIHILGKDVAGFLGYQLREDGILEVPDSTEIMGALKAINQELKAQGLEEIPITFYPPFANPKYALTNYLTQFGDACGLPYGHKNGSIVHDASYHFAAILLPASVVRLASRQTRAVNAFAQFLQEEKANLGNPPWLSLVAKLYRLHRVLDIDSATGGLPYPIAAYNQALSLDHDKPQKMDTAENEFKSRLHDALADLTGLGDSPAQLLNSYTKRVLNYDNQWFKDFPLSDAEDAIFKTIGTAEKATLDGLITKFSANYLLTDPEFKKGSEMLSDSFCGAVQQRRGEIINATKSILSRKPGGKPDGLPAPQR